MGGGGGNPIPAAAAATPAVAQIPVDTIQPFFPGQQGLLAEQMAAGYGGGLLDFQNAQSLYRPMTVPQINRPGDVTAYLQNIGLTPAAGGSAATTAPVPAGSAVAGAATPAVPGRDISWIMGSNR